MKNADMITTIKAQHSEAEKLRDTWGKMLDKDCEQINKTFKEALEDGSVYEMLSYKIWLRYTESVDTLESLMNALNIK